MSILQRILRCKPDHTTLDLHTPLLSVRCPYCSSSSFSISPPEKHKKTQSIVSPPYPEVQSLPYARDNGKFDPPDHAGWSQIGKDFLAIIKWEKFGILHMEDKHDIWYCVLQCPQCNFLFDVFANYTPKCPLSDIWPHLLKNDPHSSPITSFLSGRRIATLIVAYILSLLPNILMKWSLVEQHGGPEKFLSAEWWPTLFVRGIGALSAFFMLLISSNLIQFFQEESKFADLFCIRERDGLSYWRKFTLSRLTSFNAAGKSFTPRQIMLISGVPASVLLLSIWAVNHLQRIKLGSLSSFWSFLSHSNGYTIAASLTNLAFWLIIAYYIGTCTWRVGEIPTYILPGIRKIQLRLRTPEQFKNLEILERINLFSTLGMWTLFITAMLLLLTQIFIPAALLPAWITAWAQVAFIMLYTFIAIALPNKLGSKLRRIYPAIIILCIQWALSTDFCAQMFPSLRSHPWVGGLFFYQYFTLLVFGSFSSIVFYSLTKEMDGIIESIRKDYLNRVFVLYDHGIQTADMALQQTVKSDSWVTSNQMITKSKQLADTINTFTLIKNSFETEATNQHLLGRIVTVGSPVLSSIVLPIFINVISTKIQFP